MPRRYGKHAKEVTGAWSSRNRDMLSPMGMLLLCLECVMRDYHHYSPRTCPLCHRSVFSVRFKQSQACQERNSKFTSVAGRGDPAPSHSSRPRRSTDGTLTQLQLRRIFPAQLSGADLPGLVYISQDLLHVKQRIMRAVSRRHPNYNAFLSELSGVLALVSVSAKRINGDPSTK
jgi:hypothetical protein